MLFQILAGNTEETHENFQYCTSRLSCPLTWPTYRLFVQVLVLYQSWFRMIGWLNDSWIEWLIDYRSTGPVSESAIGISFQYRLLHQTIPINRNSSAFSLSRQTTDRQSGTGRFHHPRLKKKETQFSYLIITCGETTYACFHVELVSLICLMYSSITFCSLNTEC